MRRVRAIEGNVLLFSSGHFLGVLAARWLGLEPEAGKFFFLSTVSQKLWLRSDRAAIGRAHGQEQEAFAPFLPLIDVWGGTAPSPPTWLLDAPNEGFLLSTTLGDPQLRENQTGAQWILYDFGRTGGRCRQAVARERIASSRAFGPTRPWRSTWPPLTWTSSWPAVPPGARGSDPLPEANLADTRTRRRQAWCCARTCCVRTCNCRRAARPSSWP